MRLGDASLLDACLARIHDEQVLMYIFMSLYRSLSIYIYVYIYMCHICDMAHSYGDASLLDVCLTRIHDEQVLICIYMSLYIFVYIYMYIYMCIYICVIYVTWLIHVEMLLCSMFVLLVSTMSRCSCVFICLYIFLYIFMCIYICVYMYVSYM